MAITPTQSVEHYENFPVGSILLPKAYRQPVAAVYHMARHADDLADEGDVPAAERLAALAQCDAELARIAAGEEPLTARYAALVPVIRAHVIPVQLFSDLISAFSQDVVKTRYANRADVLDYSRRSADPVGRILLYIFNQASPENLALSDKICSALQLINFWQDVAIDCCKDRIYLPADQMALHGVTVADLMQGRVTDAFRQLLAEEVAWAMSMLMAGAPLGQRLPGRIGLEIRSIVQGGRRVLEKIRAVDFDVYQQRPVLRTFDWPLILWRALW